MNEIQNTRTLDTVAAEIRAFTASMLTNIIEIGRRMCEAKEMLPYGQFGDWIKEKTGYSSSTANNFMRLFKEYGSRQGSLFGAEIEDFQTFGKLDYSKALALLSLPAPERQDFVMENNVEAMTTRELQQAIKERDEARKHAEAAEGRAIQAEKKAEGARQSYSVAKKNEEYTIKVNKELQEKIKELESRPVEVAVQVNEEAIKKATDEARAAADASWKKEVDAVTEKLKAAEKARDEAMKASEKAEEKAASSGKGASEEVEKLKAEAKKAHEEAEQLRKQLAMSNETVTAFKLHSTAWRQAYSDMMNTLAKADAKTAEKLRAFIQAQLREWSE